MTSNIRFLLGRDIATNGHFFNTYQMEIDPERISYSDLFRPEHFLNITRRVTIGDRVEIKTKDNSYAATLIVCEVEEGLGVVMKEYHKTVLCAVKVPDTSTEDEISTDTLRLIPDPTGKGSAVVSKRNGAIVRRGIPSRAKGLEEMQKLEAKFKPEIPPEDKVEDDIFGEA